MNKIKKRILVLIIAVIMNVIGRYIAYTYSWPMYFNLCGTILASYLEGPIIGSVSAILGCAFSLIFSSSDWHFLIADIFVAVAAGLVATKNQYFKRFSLIFSATAFFAVIRTPVLLLINLSANSGKSGLYIVDAIFGYLDSLSSPKWLGHVLVALFVSFSDVLSAMLIIYFTMLILNTFGKRKNANELKRELRKKVLFGLAFVLLFSGMISGFSVKAENTISFIEKLYNSDNGLVGGCLNDVAMTKDGSMWIATYGGLFRFNGSKFVLIDNLSTVRSVQTLFVDEDDRLWAGTQDSGVTLLNIDMTWRTLDMNTGLPSNSVKSISRDSNGMYYFGTTGGLVYAEYNNGEINIVKTDTKAGNIRDLEPDSTGHMIVMSNIGEVSCYKNGELVDKLEIEHASAKGINIKDNDDIYIGTDSEAVLICRYEEGFCLKDKLICEGMKTIKDFYFDENGIIFIAADNGIGYYDNSGNLTMIETGVFNNSIDHIYKDYQGNLWFTSSRCGLLCLGRSCFTDVFKLCNEKATVGNAVKEWNGYLYVGSNTGLKILDVDAGKSIKNEITDIFDNIRIRSLDIDLYGNLIVATYDRGVMEISPDQKASEYISPRETEKMVRVVKALSDGTVISSSDAGMVFMKDHKVLGKLVSGQDLAGATVLNILEAGENILLCGTDGDGVAIIKDRKVERYINREDGLPSGVILRVVKDKNGYFILTGSGLCYMDKDYKITEIGMPYYNNFDIVTNKEGEIFVLGGAGLYICEYDDLMNNLKMTNYTLLDTKAGLPGSITSNAWNYVTDDEILYVCGTSGVYQLDLKNYEMSVDEFKTKITAIIRDGVYEDVTEVGTIFIPKDTDRIEVNLEINNYTTADPYVSFYLSGVDQEKITVPSSKLSSVSYYDIPYGNHDFVISVTDEKGRELSKQVYVFSKEREIFESVGFTLYFYLMIFTFLIFIVISIVQGALWSQRKKETGRHELIISKLEREKTEALERALHMEENASRSKSEFLANMSHDIKTPINTIIGLNTMIMRESNEENIKEYADNIDASGKELITLINNIHEFSNIDSVENSIEIPDNFRPDDIAENNKKIDSKQDKKTKKAAEYEKERYHAPDAKLLLVDSVEMNLNVAKKLLSRIEVQVDTAQTGNEAVKLCKSKQYDIILLESKMPGAEGEDTMTNIRQECEVNADTPIIVITSHAVNGAREEYLNLGYSNYLSKPLDAIKLEAMIQNYLPDDKIRFTDEEENQKDESEVILNFISRISRLEGIDISAGIETAGGEDAYIVICRSFHDMAKKRIETLKNVLTEKNLDEYTLQVFDMKNSARLIGAYELSKQGEMLENAGRDGKYEKIKNENDGFLKKYKWFYDRFDEIFRNQKD